MMLLNRTIFHDINPIFLLISYPFLSPLGVGIDKGTYEFAVSETCVILFLIQITLAFIVWIDASRRDLPAFAWAFIALIPVIGFPVYLIYIVIAGHTRFHLKKSPLSEEIKRKWGDTPSPIKNNLRKDIIEDGRRFKAAEKKGAGIEFSPYRRK